MSEKPNDHVEVVDVVQELPGPEVWGQRLDRPETGLAKNPLLVAGWVIPRRGSIVHVEVHAGNVVLAKTSLNHPRPDLRKGFPHVPDAEKAGFRVMVAADEPTDLEVEAVFDDGKRVCLGTVKLRKAAPSAVAPGEVLERDASSGGKRRRGWLPWRR